MSRVSIENMAQFIANIGVIAGIVFLGFEVHQNNELRATESHESRSEYLMNLHQLLASDEQLAALMVKAHNGEDLEPLGQYQVTNLWLSVL